MTNRNPFDEFSNFRLPDFAQFRPPPNMLRMILIGAAGILGLGLLWGTFYQVEPEEAGIVLRFGRHVRTTEPGLRIKFPFLESVIKVPVQRQLKQELGFRTVQAGVRTQFSEQQFLDEKMMLTGDLNVAVVEWIVQYRVSDPFNFLFKVRNLEETFRSMNEAVMREVVGDRTVTEVLTVGRQEIETTVLQKLQELCNQYETGISVAQVVLQDVNPPDPVKPSWDEVNQAQQQRDRLINEARAEYNKVIPRASGEAEQTILAAEGYALNRVNRAEGDAARFKDLHGAYRLAPEVTRQRLYLETMERVLPAVGAKIYLDKDAQGLLPLLPLNNITATAAGAATSMPNREGGSN
jgi:membrane protease subunit HflK